VCVGSGVNDGSGVEDGGIVKEGNGDWTASGVGVPVATGNVRPVGVIRQSDIRQLRVESSGNFGID